MEWMTREEGGKRAEWVDDAVGAATAGKGSGDRGGMFWVFWKRPEEWGDVISGFVSRHLIQICGYIGAFVAVSLERLGG